MHTQMSWWNNDKIAWYDRASLYSDFHRTLADKLSSFIDKNNSIVEVGCGLGYVAEKLYKRGYKIRAYDSDKSAITSANKRTGLDIFSIADCFNLNISSDTLLSIFFGRITSDDNFEKLIKLARKQFIYVTGGGAARHTSVESIESFLEEKGFSFIKSSFIIPFSQPFIDIKEANTFLDTYYKGELKEVKRKSIIESNIKEYPLLLENNKEITIFDINLIQ